jgi:hypothetical protein
MKICLKERTANILSTDSLLSETNILKLGPSVFLDLKEGGILGSDCRLDKNAHRVDPGFAVA